MRNRRLSRPITLRDGTVLTNIADVVDCFDTHFPAVTKFPALEHAIRLLETAARTGRRADVEAATWQVEIVLREWRLMDR